MPSLSAGGARAPPGRVLSLPPVRLVIHSNARVLLRAISDTEAFRLAQCSTHAKDVFGLALTARSGRGNAVAPQVLEVERPQ